MKKLIAFSILFVSLLAVAGCGRSTNIAQDSLKRGSDSNYSVRHAMYTQAWGLNRAVITESREKLLAQAKLAVAKGEKTADEALTDMAKEIGLDEVTTSGNFAYLTLLLVAGERADAMSGLADEYIESEKPMWKQTSQQARAGTKDAVDELEKWKPVLSDLATRMPIDTLKKIISGARAAIASEPPAEPLKPPSQ